MLSMKTLKVAIVTMGSALLLGPGMAAAVITDLSSLAPQATFFAAETLSDTESTSALSGAKHFDIDGPMNMYVVFRPRLNLDADDEYHFRIELGGMIFRVAPVLGSGDGSTTAGVYTPPDSFTAQPPTSIVRDGVGSNVAVIELTSAVTLQSQLQIELSDALAVGSLNPGSYSVTVSLHRDQFDAIDDVGAVATGSVGGSAVMVRVVNAIETTITSATATASVDVDFFWFDGPANEAVLGSAKVDTRNIGASVMVLDARDGEVIELMEASDSAGGGIVASTGVSINIEGDTSIGAFSIVENAEGGVVECGFDVKGATPDSPLKGIESNRAPTTDTQVGLVPGMTYSLCVNVDTEGERSNSTPIENQDYTANVSIAPGGTDLVYGNALSVLLDSGTIGRIRRDGTSQRVTYLTASDKYNQRLIIVNHSSKMVRYDLSGMTTEDGTTVELSAVAMAAKAAGLNVIGPRSQVVLRIGDILVFEGKNRAAATVTVNSNPRNISIATTQVNLEDGSTDTVIYD